MSEADSSSKQPQHRGFNTFADGHAAKAHWRESLEQIAPGIRIGMIEDVDEHGRKLGWDLLFHVTTEQREALYTAFPEEPLPHVSVQDSVIGATALHDLPKPEEDRGL